MTRAEFERLVAEAVTLIPKRFRREMKNLALVVEDEPQPDLLEEMEIEPPDSLYGLYQGTPLPERTLGFGNALPDRITLFQRPIEEDCEDEDEVRAVIGETLIHEVGPLLRPERGRDRGDRGAVLARRDARARGREIEGADARAPRGAEAIRPALPRAGLGRQARRRARPRARRHVPGDRPRPRRADHAAGRAGRRASSPSRSIATWPRRCPHARPANVQHRAGRLPRRRPRGRCCATSAQPVRVVGNLPYNVSSPILFKLLHAADDGRLLRDATLMLQKEVADRLVGRARHRRTTARSRSRWRCSPTSSGS